jgi:acylphosphatase
MNGTVEVLAVGSREQLGRFHERLRSGPRAARVDNIEVFPAEPSQDAKTFRIEGTW